MTFEELRIEAEKNQGAKRVGDEVRTTYAQALLAECSVKRVIGGIGCLGVVMVRVCECVSRCVCGDFRWLGLG